jgi:[ribosomal protein S5]-alanine N-acetyltransferase
MLAIESFTTERLLAERLGSQHLADLSRMHGDPRVMKTLAPAGHPNGGMLSEAETRAFLDRDAAHWEQYGYGLWALRDKTDAHFVGRAGLRRVHIGGDEVELAYALVAEDWGKGFATEIAGALLRLGFEQLGLVTIVCFTLTTNLASQRVMQKAGFRYERDLMHAGLPHVFYRRTEEPNKGTKEQRNKGTENKEQRTKEQGDGEQRIKNKEQRTKEQGDGEQRIKNKEQRTKEQGNKGTENKEQRNNGTGGPLGARRNRKHHESRTRAEMSSVGA